MENFGNKINMWIYSQQPLKIIELFYVASHSNQISSTFKLVDFFEQKPMQLNSRIINSLI